MFENPNMLEGALSYFATRKGEDGLSHIEREDQLRERQRAIQDRKDDALMQKEMDSMVIPCTHEPECPGVLCRDTTKARKAAEAEYLKAIAAIDAETAPIAKKKSSDGPSAFKSKAAATALSQPKRSAPLPKTTKQAATASTKFGLPTSLVSRPKRTPAPTNPSPMRHASAVAASRTTMGYSKGRAASATLRQTVLPKKDTKPIVEERNTSLPPAEYLSRYGEPPSGSEMWLKCKQAGCFDEDQGDPLGDLVGGEGGIDALLREDAMQDFQLTLN